MTGERPIVVRLTGVSKHFGGVRALESVDFDVRAGEIHALLGENGAGKSTILKILNGVYAPSAGKVEVNGTPLGEHTPEAAKRAGLETLTEDGPQVRGIGDNTPERAAIYLADC